MSKKIKIEIKSWLNGSILFEYECADNTIAKTVREAVKNDANLSYADLRYADLRSANLLSADLLSANLRYADLSYADLLSVDLRSADLRSANLRYADLLSAKNINMYYATDLSSLLTNQPNRLIAYKYLTKTMQSPIHDKKITYKIGEEYSEEIDDNRLDDCGEGLNIASLEWCLKETQGDLDDYIYVEVSFDPKDVVVPYFSDGKFRVSKLKVEKKLTKTFLKQYTEIIK